MLIELFISLLSCAKNGLNLLCNHLRKQGLGIIITIQIYDKVKLGIFKKAYI